MASRSARGSHARAAIAQPFDQFFDAHEVNLQRFRRRQARPHEAIGHLGISLARLPDPIKTYERRRPLYRSVNSWLGPTSLRGPARPEPCLGDLKALRDARPATWEGPRARRSIAAGCANSCSDSSRSVHQAAIVGRGKPRVLANHLPSQEGPFDHRTQDGRVPTSRRDEDVAVGFTSRSPFGVGEQASHHHDGLFAASRAQGANQAEGPVVVPHETAGRGNVDQNAVKRFFPQPRHGLAIARDPDAPRGRQARRVNALSQMDPGWLGFAYAQDAELRRTRVPSTSARADPRRP